MNHSVKRRRQALHRTHHHYYLNISVEATKLSDWRIESKLFLPELECSTADWHYNMCIVTQKEQLHFHTVSKQMNRSIYCDRLTALHKVNYT